MSLKTNFLHFDLDHFPENCRDVSDEYGERFHQKFANMDKGTMGNRMLVNYC